jgi:hypothetical protein
MPRSATWNYAVMTLNCSAHTMKQSVMPERSSDMAMACWKGRQILALMDVLLGIEQRTCHVRFVSRRFILPIRRPSR